MIKVIFMGILLLTLSACQKEQTESHVDQNITLNFEQADAKITQYLDSLDNPKTSINQSKKIICDDYPKTYKNDYIPNLLKISPAYTEDKLLKDLDVALNYYKAKLNITCP